MLEKFGLTRLRKNNAARLSHCGEKRRPRNTQRRLVCDPPADPALDEPFTGIDPQTISDIKQIIRGLQATRASASSSPTIRCRRKFSTVTDRSYLIKDGKVHARARRSTCWSSQTRVAIADYFGKSFNDDGLADRPGTGASTQAEDVPTRAPPASLEAAIHQVVEQEKVHRLIGPPCTLREGRRRGGVVAAWVEHHSGGCSKLMERRDDERPAPQRLRGIASVCMNGAAVFDPYAPELQAAANNWPQRARSTNARRRLTLADV